MTADALSPVLNIQVHHLILITKAQGTSVERLREQDTS